LDDDHFQRTVVLLLQHDEGGAYGVVLNRPSGQTVQGLMSELGVTDCGDRGPILLGGPIPGALIALHSRPSCSEHTLPGGIHLSSQKGFLFELASDCPDFLRFFVGHAGWDVGQLESEMGAGMWHVLPFDSEAIQQIEPGELWEIAMREIGGQVLDLLDIRHVPPDPSWN
jgi:putative transcriptional regulator